MSNYTGYLTDKNNNILNINENNITAGTPVLSGRIVEGKPEYVLRLEITDMPNKDSKVVKLPIKLKEKLITREFHLWLLSPNEYGTEPNVSMTYFISGPDGDELNISTQNDKSRFTAYGELYYIDRN